MVLIFKLFLKIFIIFLCLMILLKFFMVFTFIIIIIINNYHYLLNVIMKFIQFIINFIEVIIMRLIIAKVCYHLLNEEFPFINCVIYY